MPLSRIHDRASFRATLHEAREATVELMAQGEGAMGVSALGRVERQLAWMESRTAGPNTPDPEDAAFVDVGPLCVTHPSWPHDVASRLKELDYAFRRYRALAGAFDSGVDGLTRRRGILQVRYGRPAFHKRVIAPGQRMVIGSDARADFVVKDQSLAGRHLEVWWDGVVAHARALTDAPVVIDGQARLIGELENGGVLVVGRSTLRFFVEAFSPAREPAAPLGDVAAVRERLANAWAGGQLFAVIDAARSARALQLLEESVDEHASLYEGEISRGLDDEAPYLVKLSPRSGLLQRLLDEGWGRAWGIFLASTSAPKMVRRSLRRLLMVDADTWQHPLYFRFYDPRALGRFAPLATVRQRSELLAEAQSIFYEAADASLLELHAEAEQTEVDR